MLKFITTMLRRIVIGFGLGLVVMVGSLAIPFAILFGRRGYSGEIGSAASCMLNAMTGGPRVSTYSAYSALLRERGKRGAVLRERAVDFVNGSPTHCQDSLVDHRQRNLLPPV